MFCCTDLIFWNFIGQCDSNAWERAEYYEKLVWEEMADIHYFGIGRFVDVYEMRMLLKERGMFFDSNYMNDTYLRGCFKYHVETYFPDHPMTTRIFPKSVRGFIYEYPRNVFRSAKGKLDIETLRRSRIEAKLLYSEYFRDIPRRLALAMASHPRLGEYSGISASYELFHLFF
jgi:hypothetical protein